MSQVKKIKIDKNVLGSKTREKHDIQKQNVPKSSFWDVGMDFRDVGCVRIPLAINSNPFSTHSD